MTTVYTNALHDKVHNQAIEIKRLKAELKRAEQAFLRLQISRTAERSTHQATVSKLNRVIELHKKSRISLAKQLEIVNNLTIECAKCNETFLSLRGGCPYCNPTNKNILEDKKCLTNKN